MGDLHNELKYGTGPLRAIRLGTGMGEGDGVVRLDESFSAVIDWWARPDWAILAGDKLGWGVAYAPAGGAGLRSMVALANPAASGRIYVTSLMHSDGAFANIRVLAPAPIAGVGGWVAGTEGGTRDLRDSLPQRLLTNVTIAATGARRAFTTLETPWSVPVVIGPNTSIIVEPNLDNTAITATLAWRERVLLPGEPPLR